MGGFILNQEKEVVKSQIALITILNSVVLLLLLLLLLLSEI